MGKKDLNEIEDKSEKKKKKKSSIGIVISLIVLIALFVGIFFISKNYNSSSSNKSSKVASTSKSENKQKENNNKEESKENKKSIIVKVIDKDEKEKEYKHSTDAEFLRQALEEIDGLSVEGDETNTGLFVKKVNGVTADYNEDQSYWAFYINEEYCQKGVDTQEVTDGDEFKIVYTKN